MRPKIKKRIAPYEVYRKCQVCEFQIYKMAFRIVLRNLTCIQMTSWNMTSLSIHFFCVSFMKWNHQCVCFVCLFLAIVNLLPVIRWHFFFLFFVSFWFAHRNKIIIEKLIMTHFKLPNAIQLKIHNCLNGNFNMEIWFPRSEQQWNDNASNADKKIWNTTAAATI